MVRKTKTKKSKPKKILGRHFYCYYALQEVGKGKHRKVRCRCQCGQIRDVRRDHLISHHSKSCGCLARRLARIRKKTKHVSLIRISGGGAAIIDQQDENLVAGYCWKVNQKSRYVYTYDEDGSVIYLHRLILGDKLTPRLVSSHEDWDKQNCTRANLQAVTQSQNVLNWRHGTGASGFRGVYMHRGRWIASIVHQGQGRHLGSFTDPKLAAKRYDQEAILLRGPEARTNFPQKRRKPRKTPS